MNERMQELYGKACLDARDLHPTDVVNFTHCMAEKFAKLIVKECAKVNYNSPFKDGEFHARELLEHFGVEE